MKAARTLDAYFPSLGFIGGGNMASAILKGTVGRGQLSAQRVWVCDLLTERREQLEAELGVNTTGQLPELLTRCEAIVLCVKPQQMEAVLEAVAPHVRSGQVFISIAAGVPLAKFSSALGTGVRLIRVMPNTPALVGEGAAGVAAGPGASAEDLAGVLALFAAVGTAAEVTEAQLDAVTAISGSGPAYCFRMMEVMIDAGVEMGLSREVASELTLQTFLGAARLALGSEESPAALRERVTSPGGTTQAALETFEREGLPAALRAGILRAAERSRELSK